MFSLKDQVAIVTGGANGIGKGIATVLAKAGLRILILRRDKVLHKNSGRHLLR